MRVKLLRNIVVCIIKSTTANISIAFKIKIQKATTK